MDQSQIERPWADHSFHTRREAVEVCSRIHAFFRQISLDEEQQTTYFSVIIRLMQKVYETDRQKEVRLFVRSHEGAPHLFFEFRSIPSRAFRALLQTGTQPTLFDLTRPDTLPTGVVHVQPSEGEGDRIGFRLPAPSGETSLESLFYTTVMGDPSTPELRESFLDGVSQAAAMWLQSHFPMITGWKSALSQPGTGTSINVDTVSKQALDPVTHLPRKSFFSRYLDTYLKREVEDESGFALLILDIDQFARINVSLGHQIGDRVLLEVANRLRNQLPDRCFLCRWGSDEFAILVPEISSRNDIESFAATLFKILQTPIDVPDTKLFLKGSVGAVLYPEDGEDSEELITKLEQALKSAKQDTGNSYSLYTTGDREIALKQLLLTTELHQALNRDQFLLHFQPILESETGRIRAAEGLIRWNHPDRGMLTSGTFIDLLEDTGLILFLGQWILDAAAEQLQEWKKRGMDDLRLCLNMSARQFRDPSLLDKIQSVFHERGLSLEDLELEITERTLMEDMDYSREVLRELQEHGVRISLDDFGTGHSTFQYLAELPIDVLKIDRTFITSFDTPTRKAKLVDIITMMAHRLDMVSVAEGVETEQQLEYVRECGCDLVQGFYFSRPLDPSAFLEFAEQCSGSDNPA